MGAHGEKLRYGPKNGGGREGKGRQASVGLRGRGLSSFTGICRHGNEMRKKKSSPVSGGKEQSKKRGGPHLDRSERVKGEN